MSVFFSKVCIKSSWAERLVEPPPVQYISQKKKKKNPRTPEAPQTYILDQARSFACITQLDSGHLRHWSRAAAGCYGDVVRELAVHWIWTATRPIRRVGFWRYPNEFQVILGGPGLAYLVPRVHLLMKTVSIEDWRELKSWSIWWSTTELLFGTTSLHLSFTGASSPIKRWILWWPGCWTFTS